MVRLGLSLIAFVLASVPIAPDEARIAFVLWGLVVFYRNIQWMYQQRHALSMAADLETTDIDALAHSLDTFASAAKEHDAAKKVGWPFSKLLNRLEQVKQEYVKASQRYMETARKAQRLR